MNKEHIESVADEVADPVIDAERHRTRRRIEVGMGWDVATNNTVIITNSLGRLVNTGIRGVKALVDGVMGKTAA